MERQVLVAACMSLLVIDIGGTHVKLWHLQGECLGKIPSGKRFTPHRLMRELKEPLKSNTYDRISIGFPAKAAQNRVLQEPWNLGPGWVDFDFAKHLERPTRVANDAALQALGAYMGARMLFVGLGTSVGSSLVADNVIVPMELGNIPHAFGKTLEDLLGSRGLREHGPRKWKVAVLDILPRLRHAFGAHYIVLGGGNARKLGTNLPDDVRMGGNEDAWLGGQRLWQTHDLGSIHWWDPAATLPMAGD